jgi:hypothetical protein
VFPNEHAVFLVLECVILYFAMHALWSELLET